MQYNYWGCRRQKLWFWCLTVSQLVPTSIENVPVWFIMSQNVILVLRIQYYFWGCSKISEDAEGKNFYFDVSQGPNMSQRGSKGSRMLLMHSNYWKCMRMHEDAWGCTRMHEDVQGCSLVGAEGKGFCLIGNLYSASWFHLPLMEAQYHPFFSCQRISGVAGVAAFKKIDFGVRIQ